MVTLMFVQSLPDEAIKEHINAYETPWMYIITDTKIKYT